MNKNKYYICEKCGNVIELVNPSGVSVVCCGAKMTELQAGVVEASREKHIPEVKVEGREVRAVVGSVLHPMAEEHSILWVALETNQGVQRKELAVGNTPETVFALSEGEIPIAVYAYCNLHGLWKTEI